MKVRADGLDGKAEAMGKVRSSVEVVVDHIQDQELRSLIFDPGITRDFSGAGRTSRFAVTSAPFPLSRRRGCREDPSTDEGPCSSSVLALLVPGVIMNLPQDWTSAALGAWLTWASSWLVDLEEAPLLLLLGLGGTTYLMSEGTTAQ